MKSLGRNAAALLVGALTGVVIVLFWAISPRAVAFIEGQRHFLLPTDMFVQVVGITAAVFAAGCIVVAVPCWLLLRRLRLAGWVSAAILGLVLGEACLPFAGQGVSLTAVAVVGLAGSLSGMATFGTRKALSLNFG